MSSSDDEESIAVRSELVVFLEGDFVCVHYVLKASKSSDGHEHCRTRAVEVGNDCIRNGKSIRREYELVCPSVICVYLVLC